MNCLLDYFALIHMKNVNEDEGGLRTLIIDIGTVVINRKQKWIQKFPTEDEAVEYIREEKGENVNED